MLVSNYSSLKLKQYLIRGEKKKKRREEQFEIQVFTGKLFLKVYNK